MKVRPFSVSLALEATVVALSLSKLLDLCNGSANTEP